MKRIFSQGFDSVRDSALALLLPSFCLSCKSPLKEGKTRLCKECFSHMTLLDPIGRCPECFCDLEESQFCVSCHKKKNRRAVCAFCFDPIGPGLKLVSAFCNKDMANLCKAMSGFLLLQIENLGWPYPDSITYVPQTLFESMASWYNPSKLLAKKLAAMMQRPFCRLTKKEYHCLEVPYYAPQKKMPANKRILLVDAMRGQETVLCSEALMRQEYESVYILTLC